MRKQGLWEDLLGGFRSPWLYICVAVALAVWGLAWQTPASYTLDIGGRQDDAFVSHFYDKEPDRNSRPHPDFTYRWTRADSSLDWPGLGLGSLPVSITLRLAPAPGITSPVVTATVRGQAFPLALAPGLHDYSFQAAPSGFFETDFEIRLHTRTVSPPADGRDLGVLVDTATLTTIGTGVSQPSVVLPVAELLRWAVCLALLWLLAHWLSGSPRVATVVSALAAAVVVWGILAERPNLGLLAPEVPWLLLSAYPVALIGYVAATYLSPGPYREKGRAVRWTAAAFAAAYLLRVGGMVYPQFRTSDIGLHIHNIEKVLRGVLLWQGTLPNGAPSPYPPLPYIVLAPFSALVPDLSLLLRVGVGLLDASCVLPLFYLGSRLAWLRAGAWSAWVYALLVAPFALFSTGVFSNLFGQAVFTWTLAAWGGVLLTKRVSPSLWAALTTGFFLTFLSHYGMLIAAVAVAGLFVLFALVVGPAGIRRRALGVAAALVGAGIAAFLVYYINVVGLLLAPAGGVNGGRGSFDLLGLPDLLNRRLDPDLGALALLAALAGWLTTGRRARGLVVLTAAAVVAALLFAGVSMVVGDNIRYALLLAPFVALGAGLFLARIAGRGRPGAAWAVVILAMLFWQLLGAWLPLIFTRYH